MGHCGEAQCEDSSKLQLQHCYFFRRTILGPKFKIRVFELHMKCPTIRITLFIKPIKLHVMNICQSYINRAS